MLSRIFAPSSQKDVVQRLQRTLNRLDTDISQLKTSPISAFFSYHVGHAICRFTQGALCSRNLYTLAQQRSTVVTDLTAAQKQLIKSVRTRAITTVAVVSALAAIGYWYNPSKSDPMNTLFNDVFPEHPASDNGANQPTPTPQNPSEPSHMPENEIPVDLSHTPQDDHVENAVDFPQQTTPQDYVSSLISRINKTVKDLIKNGTPPDWDELQDTEKATRLLSEFSDWQTESFGALAPRTMFHKIKRLIRDWASSDDMSKVITVCKKLQDTFRTSQCDTEHCKLAEDLVPVICPTENTPAIEAVFKKSLAKLMLQQQEGSFLPTDSIYGRYLSIVTSNVLGSPVLSNSQQNSPRSVIPANPQSLDVRSNRLEKEFIEKFGFYLHSDDIPDWKNPVSPSSDRFATSEVIAQVLRTLTETPGSNAFSSWKKAFRDIASLPQGNINGCFDPHVDRNARNEGFVSPLPRTKACAYAKLIHQIFLSSRFFGPYDPIGLMQQCQLTLDWFNSESVRIIERAHSSGSLKWIKQITHTACKSAFAEDSSSYYPLLDQQRMHLEHASSS